MVSICVITRAEDTHYLDDLINSVPYGMELIILENYKTDDVLKVNIPSLVRQIGNIKYYTLGYLNEFDDFSFWKNKCKSLATGEWILFLDSDERLFYDKREFEEIEKLPKEVLGVCVNVFSYCVNGNECETVSKRLLRLFRNIDDIKYQNRCHETVEPSIEALNGNVVISGILVKHVGYEDGSAEAMIPKHYRNVKLMIKDLNDNLDNMYLLERLYASLDLLTRYKVIERRV